MTDRRLDSLTDRDADWAGLTVVVAGLTDNGFAAADALVQRGARVAVVDGRDGPDERERREILQIMGAQVHLGADAAARLPDLTEQPDLVVTSPESRLDQPVLAVAQAAGARVWSDVELAWRMRPAQGGAPWLTLTGASGTTETVQLLAGMLEAAGLRAAAVGNVGAPILHAVLAPEPLDVLAVAVSSRQLHWLDHSPLSVAPLASAVLDVRPDDHLDRPGALPTASRDLGEVYERTQLACVYNLQSPVTEQLVRDADVAEGCRAIGFTRGIPSVGMLGVVDDVLADRAFIEERRTAAAELATLDDVRGDDAVLGPRRVANALAAAALARAAGVPPVAVRDGLRRLRPGLHRPALVATYGGVTYVEDSQATAPSAASAALSAFDRVVWVAGGLLRGLDVDDVDDVVRVHARRLRAAVLIGRDRGRIAQAITRHAPDVPVVEVASTDTGVMDDVVRLASQLAQPGDTVLLAPAAASTDLFRDDAQRGQEFAAAVHRYLRDDEGEQQL